MEKHTVQEEINKLAGVIETARKELEDLSRLPGNHESAIHQKGHSIEMMEGEMKDLKSKRSSYTY